MTTTTEAIDLPKEPTRWIELEHCTLPYWRIGQGPDLVFVHGWPMHAGTWRHCVDTLQDSFTCHLIDLPGAGISKWDDEQGNALTDIAETLIEAIAAMDLGERSFGMVGQDSGGTFARLAAAQYAPRIQGMVLGNTEIPGHHPWRLNAMLPMSQGGLAPAVISRAVRSKTGRLALMAEAIADRSLIEGDLKRLFLDPVAESERAVEGVMFLPRGLKSAADFDIVADAHPLIASPVKLVWGSEDVWFPLAKVESMIPSFGGEVELVVIEGAKLLVHEDAPKRFANETLSHFQACFSAP